MSSPESPKPDDSLGKLARVVEACGRFEGTWNKGPRPRLEDFLTEARPEERAEWLLRLLGLEFSLRRQHGERFDLGEYLSRFPLDTDTVTDAYISQTVQPEPPSRPGPKAGEKVKPPPKARPSPPPRAETAAEILLAILAFQNGFIDLNACVAAVRAWSEDKSQRIGELLVRLGHIDATQRAILDALVGQHRKKHGDSPEQGLAAVDPTGMVRDALKKVDDPDVERTISINPAGPSPTPGSGETTADFGDNEPHSTHDDEEWSYWSDHSRFQDGKEHARGGLGIVFKARDCELRRQVAVKVMKDGLIGSARHRTQFLLEGLISGGLEHPGIVPVYGLGLKGDGSPFYAMKFVRGPSLKDKIRQLHGHEKEPAEEAAPTLPQLLRHFISACQAMAYAHSRGILHRDLKPEHIMLGDYGETLLVDWGLATTYNPGHMTSGPSEAPLRLPKDISCETTTDGMLVGTVAYMGPEQANRQLSTLDQRGDIYSLGAILYTLLTGQAPQKGHNEDVAIERIIAGEFPRPRSIKPSIPPALEAITLKAMALRPDDRYPTATALARDIERYLDDEPVQAYPDTLPMRAGRWLRKHRTFTAGSATLLFSSTVSLAFFLHISNQTASTLRTQQALVKQSRDQEYAARTLAESNFRDSLNLASRITFQVGRSALPNVPGAETLRRTTAELTASFLDRIVRQKPTNLATIHATSRAYRELGNIRRLLGEKECDTAYAKSLDLIRNAVTIDPDPIYRDALAETCFDAAEAQRVMGNYSKAEPLYRESVAVADYLLQAFPGNPRYIRTAARSRQNYSSFLIETGQFFEASETSERAAQFLRPLADSQTPGKTDRLELVMTLLNQGRANRGLGNRPKSIGYFYESKDRSAALVHEDPQERNSRYTLAVSRLELASTDLGDDQKREHIVAELTGAIVILDELCKETADIPHYSHDLVRALIARAWIHNKFRVTKRTISDLNLAESVLDREIKKHPTDRISHTLAAQVAIREAKVHQDEGRPASIQKLLAKAKKHIDSITPIDPRDVEFNSIKNEFRGMIDNQR